MYCNEVIWVKMNRFVFRIKNLGQATDNIISLFLCITFILTFLLEGGGGAQLPSSPLLR